MERLIPFRILVACTRMSALLQIETSRCHLYKIERLSLKIESFATSTINCPMAIQVSIVQRSELVTIDLLVRRIFAMFEVVEVWPVDNLWRVLIFVASPSPPCIS